ncbi:spore cortex biosynthesis protein YabQ [Lentibacillus sediminis]|uniref:spore cortex biosynthesis protein YabQ n=1 Tax=Lentibacillus sediminis TaxID=1940529 RepID=UPI000C1C6C15|nr:spore cortex biosynthesis protein YabQ [Lentibacillus sediminis]
MTLSVQFITMAAMVFSGFYLGIVQETFRRLTVYWKNRVVLTYVLEACFWLTQTLLIFYVLFRANGGEIRFYILLACLLGFSMYQVFAAGVYKRLLEQIIRIVAKIYRFFARTVQLLIIAPVKWLVLLLVTIITGLLKALGAVLLFVWKVLIAPIRWLFQGIWRMLPKKIQKNLHKLAGVYSTIENIYNKCRKYLSSKRR